MSDAYPCSCTTEALEDGCRCRACGVYHCSARALHEEAWDSVAGSTYREVVDIIKWHGICIPASWGRSKKEDEFLMQIAAALVNLEAQIHGRPPDQTYPTPPEEPVEDTFFDTYPAQPVKDLGSCRPSTPRRKK